MARLSVKGHKHSCMASVLPRYFLLKSRTFTRFLLVTFILFPILLTFPKLMSGQEDDTTFIFHGRVVDHSTNTGLFYVHIINLNRNRAILSDRNGFFRMEANLDDTIYFSHVGFKKRLFRVRESDRDTAPTMIYLTIDTIILKKFRLLAATREVQFRNDFISRPYVPDTLNPAFETFLKENHFPTAGTGSIVLPGPFTLIYENFNRNARLKRRIEKNRSKYYDQLPEEEKEKVLFRED